MSSTQFKKLERKLVFCFANIEIKLLKLIINIS